MKSLIPNLFVSILLAISSCLSSGATPDNFAQRQVLSGLTAQCTNNNQTATREVGEPSDTGYRSLWFSWTAPETGVLTVSLDGSDSFDKTLDVWMGSSVSALKWVAGASVDYAPEESFPVVKGTTYSFSSGSYSSSAYGAIVVSLSLNTDSPINTLNVVGLASITNDSFSSRIKCASEFASYVCYNGSASRETLEPSPGYRTMWYSYRAPRTGRLTIDTEGGWSFDKDISVWHGNSVQSLSQLIPYTVDLFPSVAFPVVAGNDYEICISSYSSSSGGPIVISFILDPNSDLNSFNLTGGAAFDCDNYIHALELQGVSPAAICYSSSATREALEPSETGYRTLWFKWTAPAAGNTQVLTQGSDDDFDKCLTVYTGSAINSLTRIAKAQVDWVPSLSFNAVAGQTYFVALGSYSSSANGSLLLSIFGQSGGTPARPALAVGRAVKLRFQTESGRTYRIQESANLKDWNSLTNVIVGNGAIQEVFVDAALSNRSFRVSAQ